MKSRELQQDEPRDGGGLELPSRRHLLRTTACGFGHVALMGLLQNVGAAIGATPVAGGAKLQQTATHFAPRAKRVIFLFMHGGVSHVDTFDPKPMLTSMDGKPLPFDKPLQFATVGNLMRSPW